MHSDEIAEALSTYFRDTPVPIVCAYLYGSHARGEPKADSDVDVGVLMPASAPHGLTGPLTTLRGDLERWVQRPVDLVDLRHAPVDLIHRILRDGRLLADREPSERIDFEVKARNEYFDLLPHLQRYRRGQAA
jgi:predicted nucleotidyltransferase